MNIETIWNNIKRHEGDIFHTIKGKPYTYRVHSDCIIVAVSYTHLTLPTKA